MLKQVGTVIVFVWMVIVKLCRSVIGRRGEKKVVPAQRTENSEWKAEWEEWEMTEVKVETATPFNQESEQKIEEPPDLFKDMAPVIHAPKKIRVKGSDHPTPNLNQFAVDPTFKTPTSELLDWSDEEGAEGWGNEELPELLRQSRQAARKKREAKERQKNTVTTTAGLGATRLS